jgi:predicted aminopeptidase
MKLRYAVMLLAVLGLALAGCESISYYGQAIGGHLGMMSAARPVEDWLSDPATTPVLRERLEVARRIRAFASRELALPDNGSYASYAEIDRPFVVWNVFAAGEFSVEPKAECFPVAGCVSYRGFYTEQRAREHAERLRSQGFDVHVAGIPAYSTLGWFDDPLLSTFIRYPDTQLARLVFHELAHQVAYARSDTAFNESFAVVVEEEGVRRWLAAEGRDAELAGFRAVQARKREFAGRVEETRERLAEVYRMPLSPEALRAKKAEEWARLRKSYPGIPEQPNNGFLVSIALYTELVPELERLLAQEGGDLRRFYRQVKEMAASGRSSPGPLSAQRR